MRTLANKDQRCVGLSRFGERQVIQRRTIELNAMAGVNLRLPVQR